MIIQNSRFMKFPICKIIVSFTLCLACVISVNAQKHSKNRRSIVIGTWNIGHFSNGVYDYSLINASNYNAKVNSYREFLYDSLRTDLLCINEFESEFFQDSIRGISIAEDVLFDGFTTQRIFKKNRYVCNAIFSNVGIKNINKSRFKYSESAKSVNSINWFYYVSADILIGRDTIKLVCTHLISRHEQECQYQMKQLIEAFKRYDKVVICGDMNSTNLSQFKDSGYSFANDGNTITFPYRSRAIDNIIAKGVKISDVRVVKTNLSDHYPVICRIACQ